MSINRPKLYVLSHGWANKYYWFSLVQAAYVGMDFIVRVKRGNIVLEIDTGRTEADSHGSTMALTFFSEKIVSLFENKGFKSFKRYPVRFTKETNLQSKYFYIDITSNIPDVRSKDIFKEPDLARYCRKNGVARSDLLKVGTDITPLYADFSKWDGSDIFTIKNTLLFVITEKIKKELSDKKIYKNLRIEEINFLSG